MITVLFLIFIVVMLYLDSNLFEYRKRVGIGSVVGVYFRDDVILNRRIVNVRMGQVQVSDAYNINTLVWIDRRNIYFASKEGSEKDVVT